jgi:hypothetical protein
VYFYKSLRVNETRAMFNDKAVHKNCKKTKKEIFVSQNIADYFVLGGDNHLKTP